MRIGCTALGMILVAVAPAAAQVMRYTIESDQDRTVLTSVTVRRGATQAIYDAKRLIGAKLIHFTGHGTHVAESPDRGAPGATRRAGLLDITLTAGTVNPGGSAVPLTKAPVLTGASPTPGMAVRFDEPVVNRPGVDVVVFELDQGSKGDAFRVSPLAWREGSRTLTVSRYDVAGSAARAVAEFRLHRHVSAPQTFEQFLTGAFRPGAPSRERGFRALAVGIDLSAMGWREGESVDGLFFQNPQAGGGFDPACVAGLPAPSGANVLKAEPVARARPVPVGPLRKRWLASSERNFEEIVFAQRVSGRDHWYGNFGHYCEDSPYTRGALLKRDGKRYAFGEGGRLCRLNLRTGKVRVILADPRGGIRDPQVHYDGRKILFSYRRGTSESYHLYEIGIDGKGLRQLTRGPDNDIEPIYLPDGGIVFCSSRCHRYVPCWRTQVAVLYRCDADGGNVRMLSNNAEQENTPWLLPDGQILFMRWEYVDRNQLTFHHLWTVRPDGTGVMVYFGNQDPLGRAALLDAKPIPGTTKAVVSFSPGHGRAEHAGYISIVDPSAGPDASDRLRHLSKRSLRDPYPVSEKLFFVADNRGIYLMDGKGNVEPVYRPSAADCPLPPHEPRPLRPRRREPVLQAMGQPDQPPGKLLLYDAYEGRNMAGVRRGEIKKLLVLEQLPKPANFSGGQEPLSIGGTFTLERVLGTVPVEPDGSAYFEVPPVRSVFFVALDAKDMPVKRMQSFVTVQPGETTSCVGCHEHRTRAPHPRPVSTPAAARRAPSRIKPVTGMPDVLDFPRDVQPILDTHCLRCHNPDRADGGVDLCGDKTPLFTTSYWTMFTHALVSDGRNGLGNRPPRSIGSSASRLMKLLDGSHYQAKLTARQRQIIRLWIDTGATYPGTYAALGSGMVAARLPTDVFQRRCLACHKATKPSYRNVKKGAVYYQFGRRLPPQPLLTSIQDIILIRHLAYFQPGESRLYQAYCNLSRPEKSLFLRAPLAKAAGGLQRCGKAVFADTSDGDYRAVFEAIQAASKELATSKRFDMPGFAPNPNYITEMQNYGILPRPLPKGFRLDVYATDRAYWRSCRPAE